MNSVLDFARARKAGRSIAVVTAYDALQARAVASAGVDAILVGDSVAMVVHGLPSTVHATLEMMRLHTAAVRRGAPEIVIVADMPFMSARLGRNSALEAAGSLVRAGATAVKVEGITGHEDVVSHLVGSGIPVMGHVGLTPQSVNALGGHRLQGKTPEECERILGEAGASARAGAFACVLECVPADLAARVTAQAGIPTIGIGAGAGTDGQVLVLTDIMGMDDRFRPRFARRYFDGHGAMTQAVRSFVEDVRRTRFPSPEEVVA